MQIKPDFCPKDCPHCVLAMVMGTYEVNGETYEGHVGVCIHQSACAMWFEKYKSTKECELESLSEKQRTCETCRWNDKPGLTDICDRCKDLSEWEGKK